MIYAEATHAIIFYEVFKKEYSKKNLIVLLFLIKFECDLNNTICCISGHITTEHISKLFQINLPLQNLGD